MSTVLRLGSKKLQAYILAGFMLCTDTAGRLRVEVNEPDLEPTEGAVVTVDYIGRSVTFR